MRIPPFLTVTASDPRYREMLRAFFLGTYGSQWDAIADATASNLRYAAVSTAQAIDAYNRGVETHVSRAEREIAGRSFTHPVFLTGPIMGTILCAAAALEQFLRLTKRGFLEKGPTKDQLAHRGTEDRVVKALGDFDSLQLGDKLQVVARDTLHRPLNDDILDECERMIRFRNSCFHWGPELVTSSGVQIVVKQRQGHVLKRASRAHPKDYPTPLRDWTTLALTHALRAVRAHDRVCCEIFRGPGFPRKAFRFGLEEEDRAPRPIEMRLPKKLTSQHLDELAEGWQQVLQAWDQVPKEETRQCFLDIRRRLTIRPIR